MDINLSTERTILRCLHESDASNFYKLNLDSEVIKYTGDKAFKSVEDARIFIDDYDQYTKYGVGRLAVIHKKSNEFLGWCGLKFSADLNEYDIGFRFYQEFWNKGYATETALACIQNGFENKGIDEVIGRTMTANKASIACLKKLGMNLKSECLFDDKPGLIYALTKEEFLLRKGL